MKSTQQLYKILIAIFVVFILAIIAWKSKKSFFPAETLNMTAAKPAPFDLKDCDSDIAKSEICKEEESKEAFLKSEGTLMNKFHDWRPRFQNNDLVNYIGLGRALGVLNIDTKSIEGEIYTQATALHEQEYIAEGWGFSQVYDKKIAAAEAVELCSTFSNPRKSKTCLFGVGKALSVLQLVKAEEGQIPDLKSDQAKWVEMGYGYALGFMNKKTAATAGPNIALGVKDGRLIREILSRSPAELEKAQKKAEYSCAINAIKHHSFCFLND